MKVSIITPTFNRAHHLEAYLVALSKQTFQDFELILVNDGSSDHTEELITSIVRGELYSFIIKDFHISNSGRSGARNYAVNQSSGDLLVFYDDDTRPNPNSLASHLEFHDSRENAILGGPYIYEEARLSSSFQVYRAKMEDKWYDLSGDVYEIKSLRINGGNFSISSALFASIGGFNENLADKEDFLLAYEAHKHFQTEVFLDPNTWVYHDDFKSLRQYISRLRATTAEEQKLMKIDSEILAFQPERFRKGHFSLIRRVLNQLLIKPITVDLLSTKFFRWLVPGRIKHLIYDLTITAHKDRQKSINSQK